MWLPASYIPMAALTGFKASFMLYLSVMERCKNARSPAEALLTICHDKGVRACRSGLHACGTQAAETLLKAC